jgi:hypothetical protein
MYDAMQSGLVAENNAAISHNIRINTRKGGERNFRNRKGPRANWLLRIRGQKVLSRL